MPRAIRLTPRQVELLTDIATKPQMFITRYSRRDRTASVLVRHNLAVAMPGFAGSHQYGIEITDDGRREAFRRGIGGPPTSETEDAAR